MTSASRKVLPTPPRPELLRRPTPRFGWLDQSLLSDGWLGHIGNNGTAVLVLLALAADKHGASFFSRERMARSLGISRHEVDEGLDRLLGVGLVAFRPGRPAHIDGVWQLLPVPQMSLPPRNAALVAIAGILDGLGLAPAIAPRRLAPPNSAAE